VIPAAFGGFVCLYDAEDVEQLGVEAPGVLRCSLAEPAQGVVGNVAKGEPGHAP
jgi:hypothetical protein